MNLFNKKPFTTTRPVLVAILFAGFLAAGCDESFLEPDPKSFLSPQTTFTTQGGLEGVLVNLNETFRDQFYSVYSPLMLEYFYSDIAVNGNPDPGYRHDLETQLTPTSEGSENLWQTWNRAYGAISHSNLIVSNVDNVRDWESEASRNEILAAAYWHRSYWYYHLVHRYGDVPVYLDAIQEPRLDFNSYEREAILMKIRDDMEFAVQWLPESVMSGEINRAAGYYLLTKVYLSLRQFQDAVDAASQVLDGTRYELMRERFGQGPHSGDPRFNVLWDLHQKENKSLASNTEAILVVQDDLGLEGNFSGGTQMIYACSPAWWWTPVRDPNGVRGTTDSPRGNPLTDSLGRGVGQVRTTDHFNYVISSDPTDLRYSDVNWFTKEEFYYNEPESEYYGQPFVAEYIGDTTRTWYPFPYNKVYVRDDIRSERKLGGHSDWYVYRLAGLYLLRAEAYYWMGQTDRAAADINVVRERAEAQPVGPGAVTIEYIFDERARELYLEELRKSELTRAAYIMAQEGRNGYSLETMHQNNWYYDRVINTNRYYRDEIQYGPNPYTMRPHHVYWPIPQDEIDSNVLGRINQNAGYAGAESNVEPLGYDEIQQLAEGGDES